MPCAKVKEWQDVHVGLLTQVKKDRLNHLVEP